MIFIVTKVDFLPISWFTIENNIEHSILSISLHCQNTQMFAQGSGLATLYEPGSHATTTKSSKCYSWHGAKHRTNIFARSHMEASALRWY